MPSRPEVLILEGQMSPSVLVPSWAVPVPLEELSWDQQGQAPLRNSGAKDGGGVNYFTSLILILALPNHALRLIPQQIPNWGEKLGQQECHLMRGLDCAPLTSRDREGGVIVWI